MLGLRFEGCCPDIYPSLAVTQLRIFWNSADRNARLNHRHMKQAPNIALVREIRKQGNQAVSNDSHSAAHSQGSRYQERPHDYTSYVKEDANVCTRTLHLGGCRSANDMRVSLTAGDRSFRSETSMGYNYLKQ